MVGPGLPGSSCHYAQMDSATTVEVTPVPTIPRYRIAREIGHGAMGVVYEAKHTELGRRVALKVLQPHLRANATARARFAREGRVAARLRHPHIIEVLDAGTCEQGPFLVMEYVDGPTFAAHLRESKRLAPQDLLELVFPIVSALVHAHAAGVVHRDVKPANVLLARDRFGDLCPKIGDFGLGKLLDESVDRSLTKDGLVGSLPYLAPEQVREARAVDGRADQYSLAVLLYEALAGRLPFAASGTYALMEAICAGNTAPLTAVAPDVPVALAQIVQRAMRVQPEDRYPSLAALGRELVPFSSGRSWALWTREFGSSADPPEGTLVDPIAPPAEGNRASGRRWAQRSLRRIVLPSVCFALGGVTALWAVRATPAASPPATREQAEPRGPALSDESMERRNTPEAPEAYLASVTATVTAPATTSSASAPAGPLGSSIRPLDVHRNPAGARSPNPSSTRASSVHEVGGNNAPILE